MLSLPLLDPLWLPPRVILNLRQAVVWACVSLIIGGLLLWQPAYANYALTTLLLAAFPEEWFFRAYLMNRLGVQWRVNLIASLLFSILHGLTRGWTTAALVFLPSLFYGWLYQRTRDLPLLILIHGLSNLIYVLFAAKLVITYLPIFTVN